jgi:hypothetical protein
MVDEAHATPAHRADVAVDDVQMQGAQVRHVAGDEERHDLPLVPFERLGRAHDALEHDEAMGRLVPHPVKHLIGR